MTYWELLEECKTIYTELSYNSRFVRIACFHLIGKTVIENHLNPEKISNFAIAIGVQPDDLLTAILFVRDYSNLDDFNHDKTISWDQIKNQYAQNKETKV